MGQGDGPGLLTWQLAGSSERKMKGLLRTKLEIGILSLLSHSIGQSKP